MLIASLLREKGQVVHTCGPEETLTAFTQRLDALRVGALVVVDTKGKPVGVASERDVVRRVAREGAAALSHRIADIMTRAVVTVSPEETVDAALSRMTDRRIRHLPVMEGSKLVGMISIGDLVKAKIDLAVQEAQNLRAYIEAG
jgi:CBS domain-containing protein